MKTLIVIQGATGSGKTELALQLALQLGSEIISADSRQIYTDIPIGTAAPTPEQLHLVKHHFVGLLPLDGYFSAGLFEEKVLALLPKLWEQNDYAIMCGGSMMYVDAVVNGIDPLPTVLPEYRDAAWKLYEEGGLTALRDVVKHLDPAYYEKADLNNHKRLIHAIEISRQAGVPYSTLCSGTKKKRDFEIIKMAINHPREQLFERINRRVDRMIDAGLEEEARKVYPMRHLNSLNTVGFKEMFAMIDGTMSRDTAIARIAKNTRVYAKKQLTWMQRDPEIHFLNPAESLITQANDIIARYSQK